MKRKYLSFKEKYEIIKKVKEVFSQEKTQGQRLFNVGNTQNLR